MTIAGIGICLAVVVRLIIERDIEKNVKFFCSATILLSIFQNIGNFGGVIESLTLDRFMMIISILYNCIFYLIIKQKGKWIENKNKFYIIIGLFIVVAIGIINIGLNSSKAQVVLPQTNIDNVTLGRDFATYPTLGGYTIQSLVWLFIFVLFCSVNFQLFHDKEYVKSLREQIIKGFYILFIMLIVEFMYSNLYSHIYYRQFINNICGVAYEDTTYMNGVQRFGFYVAYGFYSEPSCVYSILIYYLIMLKRGFYSKIESFWFLLSFLALLVSGSALCYSIMLVGIVVICYQMFKNRTSKKNRHMAIVIFVIAIIGGIIIAKNYSGTVDAKDSIIGKLYSYLYSLHDDNSGYLRKQGNLYCYNVLKYNPLFGVGVGTTRGFGFIPGTLATLGMIGTFVLLCFYKFMFNLNITKNKLSFSILIIYLTSIYSTWHAYGAIIIAILLCFNAELLEKDIRENSDEKSIDYNA